MLSLSVSILIFNGPILVSDHTAWFTHETKVVNPLKNWKNPPEVYQAHHGISHTTFDTWGSGQTEQKHVVYEERTVPQNDTKRLVWRVYW